MVMKPLNEMADNELADLVEFVSKHETKSVKTSIDLKLVVSFLRGEATMPDDFELFNRSGAFELFKGPSFMFSLYEQLIDRLQPPEITLTDLDMEALTRIREIGDVSFQSGPGALSLPDRNKIAARLFDLGLTEHPHRRIHYKLKLSAAGEAILDAPRSTFTI